MDSDKDAHPARNKRADSRSSCEALPKHSQMKTGQWGFGGFRKHCFPSGCVCQPLLYQEGLLLLILTFKSLSLTSVHTDPGVHFTAGTADRKQFNVHVCERLHGGSLFCQKYTFQKYVLNVGVYLFSATFAHWLLHTAVRPEELWGPTRKNRVGDDVLARPLSSLSCRPKQLLHIITSIYWTIISHQYGCPPVNRQYLKRAFLVIFDHSSPHSLFYLRLEAKKPTRI